MYETVIEKESKKEYQVLAQKTGENPQACPVCSDDRKKAKVKCFSYNAQIGQGRCNHCGIAVYRKDENYKSYVRPLWENKTELSDKVVEWFAKRNISQETLVKMKVTEGVEWMPHTQKEMNVIKFNYFRDGVLINVKSRSGDKGFKMHKDAEKIFYNIDGIKDAEEIICVEGEADCLTLIQAGYTNTVSVPNGATKGTNNLDYLNNCYEYFEKAKKVHIATDNDEAGENLANELARRIGVEKCYRVQFGEYKDANEQLCKSGKVDISNSKPYPIAGVFGVEDHWQDFMNLLKNGFPKGWKPRGKLGELLSFHPGYTTIITGVPSHGKSTILDNILLQMSIDHNLNGAYFSPENWPTELHILTLVEKINGKSAFKTHPEEILVAKKFLQDHIVWVYPEEGFTLDTILEKMRQAVMKFGINWFVIDPWNKLEHIDEGESETKYVSRCLDKISNFNKKNGTHSFIVAHPTKMKFNHDKGCYEVPGLYDISGSANFYNKADIGLVAYKEPDQVGKTRVIVSKVKFKFWGAIGEVGMYWDETNGRYNEGGADYANWVKQDKVDKLTPIQSLLDLGKNRENPDESDPDSPF